MTNQVQVPDWWHRNDRDSPPTLERTAVRHYAKLASDLEWAVAARDGITETQLLALRDAYFAALDATAILHDGQSSAGESSKPCGGYGSRVSHS